MQTRSGGGGWAIHTGIYAGSFSIFTYSSVPSLYFGDSRANSAVYRWDSGNTDNGQAIDWIFETSELDLKSYFKNKTLKYLYVFFETTQANTITAYYALNGTSTYTQLQETVSSYSATGTDIFKRWVLPGLTGSSIRFKLEENSASGAVKLVKVGIVAVEKRMRTN